MLMQPTFIFKNVMIMDHVLRRWSQGSVHDQQDMCSLDSQQNQELVYDYKACLKIVTNARSQTQTDTDNE